MNSLKSKKIDPFLNTKNYQRVDIFTKRIGFILIKEHTVEFLNTSPLCLTTVLTNTKCICTTGSRGISPHTIVSIPIVLRQINLSGNLKIRNIQSIDLEGNLNPIIKCQIKISFVKLCVFNSNHL